MTLTIERLRKILSYDAKTGLFVWRVNIGKMKTAGKIAGRRRPHDGYWSIRIDGKNYMAHRLAWFYERHEWPSKDIDHINLNRTDNRLANLREATRQENLRNTPLRSNNKSGFKGVVQKKGTKRFTASITLSGKQKHLGSFKCPTAAHFAYCKAAKEYFGQFARAS